MMKQREKQGPVRTKDHVLKLAKRHRDSSQLLELAKKRSGLGDCGVRKRFGEFKLRCCCSGGIILLALSPPQSDMMSQRSASHSLVFFNCTRELTLPSQSRHRTPIESDQYQWDLSSSLRAGSLSSAIFAGPRRPSCPCFIAIPSVHSPCLSSSSDL
jgi:hypothetical protein